MVVPGDSGADGSAGSAKRECKGLHAGIEELDFELPIGDGHGLADELIESLLGNCADALVVDVDPMSRTRQLPIHEYAKPHRGAWLCRSHNEMQIAGVKPVRDTSTALFNTVASLLTVHSPDSAQSLRRNRVGSE